MANKTKMLEETVRHSFTAVAETHKIHEVDAELCHIKYRVVEIIRIVSAAITSAGIISIALSVNETWVKLGTAIISCITLIVSGVAQAFDLKSNESEHSKTASKLVRLRDNYITLLLEIRAESSSYNELLQKYKELEGKKHDVYEEAPRTTSNAVKIALKRINKNKDNSFSNTETNILLPETLWSRENDNC